MTGAEASPATVFALLDDSSAGTGASPRACRLYTDFSHEHRCTDPATLEACWAAVAADQQRGLHALLLADYEWGAKLLGAGCERLQADDASALRLLMFRDMRPLSAAQAAEWLQQQDADQPVPTPAGPMALSASVDEAAFHAAISAIHEAIRDGETYQVNYTYRLSGRAHGSPVGLYRRLRARQPVAYGAFIALPPEPQAGAVTHLLSLSPELFLRHEAGLLTARPMKGTAGRLHVPESDSEAARLLQQDVKNRAENLMIVDLLRNDLGRIAQVGSVNVPALFAVEPYATVFQMTSTVQAQLNPDIGFPELLRATFPCGSITGAPKHHTMDLISRFESTPRGAYCGAIGWIDAPAPGAAYSSIGDFCLSVAIRTLALGAEDPLQGSRPLRLGIGAGIVQDSVAADEYDECRLKARFLTGMDPGFELFETMRVERHADGGLPTVLRLAGHLARLQASAQDLGFSFDSQRALAAIAARLGALDGTGPWRLRLALSHHGDMRVDAAALPPLATLPDGSVGLVLAPTRLARRALSAYKTTLRQRYDAGIGAAEAAGAFDSLFIDAHDRVVEGGRTTLFARLDGRWVTPPVGDGALPGVLRAAVLAGEVAGFDGGVLEARLSGPDVLRAEALRVSNALRGCLPATLMKV
jgi:para-aminobenzoate synthetase / 4-amino-4-deoxychorismate lyase